MEKLEQLVNERNICVRCIGRAVGQKGSTNLDSSIESAIKLENSIISKTVEETDCILCKGLVLQAINYVEKIIDELKKYEFENFLIGCSLSKDFDQANTILENYGFNPISLKFEIRKEMGLRVSKYFDLPVEFKYPDITIIYKAEKNKHTLDIRSVYILGKYWKLKRGIPQTRWPCSNCKGRGCDECNNTGQQYPTCVELEVTRPFIEVSEAPESSFHGAGREDIDALMLGTGRPFVLELKSPKIRTYNLEKIVKKINESEYVDVSDLRYCDKDMIAFLKQGSANAWKVYRAKVELANSISQDALKELKEFGEKEQILEQRTPNRVSHRRSDKIRRKKIYSVDVEKIDEKHLYLDIHAQGGAYIKEFISSDEGRTTPSIAGLLNTGAVCTALDVLEVDDHGVFNNN